jgi:paired amphipathic helix protein Sin3a
MESWTGTVFSLLTIGYVLISLQREWDKVWRDQTQKNFWQSLDHQGINVKANDKRLFATKNLQSEIQAIQENQEKQRINKSTDTEKFQLSYHFTDIEVILDACHLLLVYISRGFPNSTPENVKMENWIKEFIPLFFGLDSDRFAAYMTDVYDETPPNETADDDTPTPDEGSSSRGRRHGKKQDLLRGVLDRRNGKYPRTDGSNAGSKESTPDVSSAVEDDNAGTESANDDAASADVTTNKWMEHPPLGNMRNKRDVQLSEPYKRDSYNMYSNVHMYAFFRLFEWLYSRLLVIKQEEDTVREDVRRSMIHKPATELMMVDKTAADYFADTSDDANYYQQILHMTEECFKNVIENKSLEEVIRRFYPKGGAKMFTADKLCFAIVKTIQSIMTNDGKDRSWDIMYLFMKDREKEETTHNLEVQYRKQAERLCKDGEMYRITFVSLLLFFSHPL